MPDQGMVSLCIVCKERAGPEPVLCQGWECPGVLPTSPRGSSVPRNGLGVPLPSLNLCCVVLARCRHSDSRLGGSASSATVRDLTLTPAVPTASGGEGC